MKESFLFELNLDSNDPVDINQLSVIADSFSSAIETVERLLPGVGETQVQSMSKVRKVTDIGRVHPRQGEVVDLHAKRAEVERERADGLDAALESDKATQPMKYLKIESPEDYLDYYEIDYRGLDTAEYRLWGVIVNSQNMEMAKSFCVRRTVCSLKENGDRQFRQVPGIDFN